MQYKNPIKVIAKHFQRMYRYSIVIFYTLHNSNLRFRKIYYMYYFWYTKYSQLMIDLMLPEYKLMIRKNKYPMQTIDKTQKVYSFLFVFYSFVKGRVPIISFCTRCPEKLRKTIILHFTCRNKKGLSPRYWYGSC